MYRKLGESEENVLEEGETKDPEPTFEETEEEKGNGSAGVHIDDKWEGPLNAKEMLPTHEMMAAANPYANPLHPLNPFKQSFNVLHHYMTPHGMVTRAGHSTNGDSDDDIDGQMDNWSGGSHFGHRIAPATSNHFGMIGVPSHIGFMDHCSQVERKALDIAKRLVRNQNKVIFRKLMNYLLKSKFLIGATESKLTKIMHRKIYNVMKGFSVMSPSNIEFVDAKYEPELSDEDDEEVSGVQDIDFSEKTYQPPEGSDAEALDLLNDNLDEQVNPHRDH